MPTLPWRGALRDGVTAWSAGGARRDGRLILAAVVGLGTLLRLYGLTLPLVDSLHQRQTQTAMVTRNLLRDGMNVLYPRYDHLGTPTGYAVLEFPLFNVVTAMVYLVTGHLELVGRVVSVACSIPAMVLTHRLARRFLSPPAALGATAVFALSMTNVYMSRAHMPESMMMLLLLGGIVAYFAWLDRGTWRAGLAAALLTALAVLVKAPAVLVLAPCGVAWLMRYGWVGLRRWQLYAFVAAVVGPSLLWNAHGSQVNRAYAPDYWSVQGVLLGRLSPWELWSGTVLSELTRSTAALLTPIALPMAVLGVVVSWRDAAFRPLHAWLAVWSAFIAAYPALNAGHPYYQLPLLPPLAVYAGRGGQWLWPHVRARLGTSRLGIGAVSLAAVSLAAAAIQLVSYSYFFRSSYDISERVPHHLAAARAVRERTPADAVVILSDLNASNTTFTYYADRKTVRFELGPGEDGVAKLEELRRAGGRVFVAIDSAYYLRAKQARQDPRLWEHLTGRYSIMMLEPHFMVVDLRPVA